MNRFLNGTDGFSIPGRETRRNNILTVRPIRHTGALCDPVYKGISDSYDIDTLDNSLSFLFRMNTTPSVRATTLSRTSEERGPDMSVRTWLPLIALVCCVFLLNFSEFAPIGLLTDISKDFGISESTTGLIISVYAWAVAILSLPLMLLLRRMQYRPMLLMCIALFVVFQVITGLSNSTGCSWSPVWGWLCPTPYSGP